MFNSCSVIFTNKPRFSRYYNVNGQGLIPCFTRQTEAGNTFYYIVSLDAYRFVYENNFIVNKFGICSNGKPFLSDEFPIDQIARAEYKMHLKNLQYMDVLDNHYLLTTYVVLWNANPRLANWFDQITISQMLEGYRHALNILCSISTNTPLCLFSDTKPELYNIESQINIDSSIYPDNTKRLVQKYFTFFEMNSVPRRSGAGLLYNSDEYNIAITELAFQLAAYNINYLRQNHIQVLNDCVYLLDNFIINDDDEEVNVYDWLEQFIQPAGSPQEIMHRLQNGIELLHELNEEYDNHWTYHAIYNDNIVVDYDELMAEYLADPTFECDEEIDDAMNGDWSPAVDYKAIAVARHAEHKVRQPDDFVWSDSDSLD